MMTTLKRIASAIVAISSYGTYAYDSTEGKPKFLDENGLLMALNSDGLRDQNLIVNGGFDYAQRQVAATLTSYTQTASRQYAADRWGITNENASVQYQQADTIAAPESGITARYYGKFSKITTAGKIEVSQPVEAAHCAHLRGKKCRVQLKLKASASKTIRVALLQLNSAGTADSIPGIITGAPSGTFISAHGANGTDPTFGTNLAKINPDTADNATIANTGLTCSVTTAWQKFGGTFTLPSNFVNLMVVIFTDSQFAAADILSITEVGLYDGVEIRDWAAREQPQQYAACQRTYYKSFPLATLPANNAGLTGAWRGYVSVAAAVANQPIGIRLPVPMRTTFAGSAIVIFNPSAANAFVRNTTAASDATASSLANASEQGADITFTGNAAWTVGQALAVHVTIDNEF